MSWQSMAMELTGQTPVPFPFALTLINRSWRQLQREFLWSFLYGDAAIPTPIPITVGTVSVAIGDPTVVGDAAASAAWIAQSAVTANPLTTMQFRIGQGTIYNIIAFDGVMTLTLDKPFVDPVAAPGGVGYGVGGYGAGGYGGGSVSGVGYQIVGIYYNAPTVDFLWWESIKDPISGYSMKTTLTRQEIDDTDPQRFQSGWPVGPVPYMINPQPGNFFGFPMYEMWPAPMNNYTYVGTYFREGADFVNPTDTVNPKLGEDVVIARGKMYSYEWCMVNPDKVPKADYRYAYGLAKKEYDDLIDGYILKDETFSHRSIIPYGDNRYIQALPWVSAREGIGYLP